MTEANNEQQVFAQSLRAHLDKLAADKPHVLRVRRLNQAMVAEVRRRLQEGLLITHLGAVADEGGQVRFIETEDDITADALMQQLQKSAADREVFAASLCTLVERRLSGSEKLVLFIQTHTEDRTGFAVMSGVPADEKDNTGGLTGITGPAVAVYGKKIAPVIFASA